jgi:hypothetical protein
MILAKGILNSPMIGNTAIAEIQKGLQKVGLALA